MASGGNLGGAGFAREVTEREHAAYGHFGSGPRKVRPVRAVAMEQLGGLARSHHHHLAGVEPITAALRQKEMIRVCLEPIVEEQVHERGRFRGKPAESLGPRPVKELPYLAMLTAARRAALDEGTEIALQAAEQIGREEIAHDYAAVGLDRRHHALDRRVRRNGLQWRGAFVGAQDNSFAETAGGLGALGSRGHHSDLAIRSWMRA